MMFISTDIHLPRATPTPLTHIEANILVRTPVLVNVEAKWIFHLVGEAATGGATDDQAEAENLFLASSIRAEDIRAVYCCS